MRIPAEFNGPPGSGNGGWSAGLVAAASGLRHPEVTLRLPPPLDTELTLAGGELRDPAGALVAQVAEGEPVTGTVPPVDPETAARAAAAYPGLTDHPFPGCYVCGPRRPDGLRIFPGPVGDGRTAAPWTAPERPAVPTMWAALDCPGGWAVIGPGRPYVLGRIAATVHALPEPGAACVVTGAAVAAEGRKARVLSTVYGPDGAVLGTARATWIRVG
ncbi:hypothetical protein [Spirilliplanes yamanashiensis]|uniref:Thioesterase superfamily protein n=1 Tax=Spirilliplanes yamanashiensis TaxID=42233 RepID=A0A8J4DH46_9ACTN|nr:hypothetical protein [Spirilliplanes yamanashiensis]MDP9820086.1 hypothetical protein [Spirilliplanes yamanashiensis]GIJ01093.1 hypothetical protein Sya03_04450 [Spirilliplanes yamanashiensis]